MKIFCILLLQNFMLYSKASPQLPEINDQFETIEPETSTTIETTTKITTPLNKTLSETNDIRPIFHVIINLYNILRIQITKLIFAPKIRSVLRNIGTCMVNGGMELVSYYLPAPIIPLITTVAGMVIPFEPVVMLKRRIPVTSYRRAISTAINTFMNTFNNYKLDYDDDPYMTRRFNRRFMKESIENMNLKNK